MSKCKPAKFRCLEDLNIDWWKPHMWNEKYNVTKWHRVSKMKPIIVSLHQRNGPVTFCFQPEICWRAQPAERIIQPHTAYLGAAAWWKTDPAYSAHTSHPHHPPLPAASQSGLAVTAAAAAATAPRGNLHFNRQSCSPSPNEGMCSGKQQETHPAARFQWTLQTISGPEKMIFLATRPPCLELMAVYIKSYLYLYLYKHSKCIHTDTHAYFTENKLLWNEIWYGAILDQWWWSENALLCSACRALSGAGRG